MEIRDVLHGSIKIEPHERPILDSKYFQRLRQIKQLGFAEYSYPSATHNRYVHSLGAMQVASRAYETLFEKSHYKLIDTSPETYKKLKYVLRLAAMLHDIGHGPLSHTTEFAMPQVSKLDLPKNLFPSLTDRQATHEDYTLKIILDSDLTHLIELAGNSYGFKPEHIAALIDPSLPISEDFFTETIGGQKINFRPVLQQLISSELDADRMDYLQRDSFYGGVSYGQFDYDWLSNNLTTHFVENQNQTYCHLAIEHRALYAFEDFLISRYHMFLMVYFHHKSGIYDAMLAQYFKSAPGEYILPSSIDDYCNSNDAELYAALAQSKNEWAKRISQKKPYQMLIELHSGIPAGRAAQEQQEELLLKIKKDLDHQNVHYLETKATGELSKYFGKPGHTLYVRYNNLFSSPSFIALEKCTDLFDRYREKRSITRLYVSPETLHRVKTQHLSLG